VVIADFILEVEKALLSVLEWEKWPKCHERWESTEQWTGKLSCWVYTVMYHDAHVL